jgi:hypothetical protein
LLLIDANARGTFVLISDQEFASSPPRSSDFFACGKPILRLRHLLPAPGVQTPNKKKSMLVYFMASPAINLQSTSPSSQHTAQQHSSQQYQQQVPVLAQELAAAASYYQPALLPAASRQHRRCRFADARISDSELRSPASLA